MKKYLPIQDKMLLCENVIMMAITGNKLDAYLKEISFVVEFMKAYEDFNMIKNEIGEDSYFDSYDKIMESGKFAESKKNNANEYILIERLIKEQLEEINRLNRIEYVLAEKIKGFDSTKLLESFKNIDLSKFKEISNLKEVDGDGK